MKKQSPGRVCHISTVHTVKDIRIFYKECRSLVSAGFDVSYIVCHDRKEILDGVHIIPLPFTSSRFRRIFVLTRLALEEARKLDAQVYHIHDPELLPIGLFLRLTGKKVIYDAHEHLAKDILDKPWIRTRLIRVAVSIFAGALEKFCSTIYTGVIGATDHIAAQFNPRKTVAVRNFPMLSFIAEIPKPPKRNDRNRRIVYTGGLTRIRGIVQLVAAMHEVPKHVELILAGQWEDSAMEKECRQLPGWSNCRFVGLIPQSEAYALMKGSDIGILTFLPAANHYEAMPNKAFEYLACGLPLVISDFPYWRSLFGEKAQYVDPTSPSSIAHGINKMLESLQTDGKHATSLETQKEAMLSWETEEKVLIDFYQKILQYH